VFTLQRLVLFRQGHMESPLHRSKTMHEFIMACIELQNTGQNTLTHRKTRMWLPVAFNYYQTF